MKEIEKKVRFDSDEAASIQTVTGWVSRGGRYLGTGEHNERQARWEGCTHVDCSVCGKEIEKSRTICKECQASKYREKVLSYPEKEWDGVCMIWHEGSEKWFTGMDDVEEYLADLNESGDAYKLSDLILFGSEPNYMSQVDESTLSMEDDLPEDMGLDDVASKEVLDKIKELNELIAKQGPISWSPAKFRIKIKN